MFSSFSNSQTALRINPALIAKVYLLSITALPSNNRDGIPTTVLINRSCLVVKNRPMFECDGSERTESAIIFFSFELGYSRRPARLLEQ